ncbi:hypothetical protein JCM6882_001897 [Rhodosporidiobolus microsporus]
MAALQLVLSESRLILRPSADNVLPSLAPSFSPHGGALDVSLADSPPAAEQHDAAELQDGGFPREEESADSPDPPALTSVPARSFFLSESSSGEKDDKQNPHLSSSTRWRIEIAPPSVIEVYEPVTNPSHGRVTPPPAYPSEMPTQFRGRLSYILPPTSPPDPPPFPSSTAANPPAPPPPSQDHLAAPWTRRREQLPSPAASPRSPEFEDRGRSSSRRPDPSIQRLVSSVRSLLRSKSRPRQARSPDLASTPVEEDSDDESRLCGVPRRSRWDHLHPLPPPDYQPRPAFVRSHTPSSGCSVSPSPARTASPAPSISGFSTPSGAATPVGETFPAGEYMWPLIFLVPSGLPPTLDGDGGGKVVYLLKASSERCGVLGGTARTQIEIPVHSLPRDPPLLPQAVRRSADGWFDVELALACATVPLGESLSLSLNTYPIHNEMSLRRLSIQVVQQITGHTDTPHPHNTRYFKLLEADEGDLGTEVVGGERDVPRTRTGGLKPSDPSLDGHSGLRIERALRLPLQGSGIAPSLHANPSDLVIRHSCRVSLAVYCRRREPWPVEEKTFQVVADLPVTLLDSLAQADDLPSYA